MYVLRSYNLSSISKTPEDTLGSRKKGALFRGPATKAFSPSLGLLAIETFLLTLIKKFFFLIAWYTRLAPPPINGPATKKITFFVASPINYIKQLLT